MKDNLEILTEIERLELEKELLKEGALEELRSKKLGKNFRLFVLKAVQIEILRWVLED